MKVFPQDKRVVYAREKAGCEKERERAERDRFSSPRVLYRIADKPTFYYY